jgi:hypothetical protein
LHWIANFFSGCLYENSSAHAWCGILNQAVAAGFDLYAIDHSGQTPFCKEAVGCFSFVGTLYLPSQYRLPATLLRWLATLRESAVDLQEFGRREMALGLRDGLNYKGFCRLQCRKVWQDWSQRVDFHVISVTYGPRPCDWKVWYSEPSDPYAG